jgi:sorting nexin-4
MAAAYQGLGYLESGITEPLNRFAAKMLDFSALLKHMVGRFFLPSPAAAATTPLRSLLCDSWLTCASRT